MDVWCFCIGHWGFDGFETVAIDIPPRGTGASFI